MKKHHCLRLVCVAVCLMLSLSGCAWGAVSGFVGGETITPERLEEISAMLFATEASDTVESIEPSRTETYAGTSASPASEVTSEPVSEPAGDPADETANRPADGPISEPPEAETVFWTAGGRVWHLDADCYHLRTAKVVETGSVHMAMEAGKSGCCTACQKRHAGT